MRTKTLLFFLLALAFAACRVAAGPRSASADSVPPSVPTNLVATPGTNAIGLTWTASTDNVGVTGYTVRRNGTPVATSAATSYVDTGLQASTTYTFTLSPFDAPANTSPQSSPPPSPPLTS